ncbi:MAG TPA: YcaO-like family protein [Longimicrobium sp.]|nr:YcaO-like family protein [Longimicrobium sp.]
MHAAPRASEAPPIRFRGQALRAAKSFTHGTHRCVSPEETLERIRPHFATAGITRLADITGLDRIGIPTFVSYRPNGRTLSSAAGKGFTPAAAQVSAAMEAIELYHAENLRLPAVRATYAELEQDGAVVPEERLPLSRRAHFRRDHPEWWVQGWDVVGQREVFLPHAAVSMVRHPGQRPIWSLPFVLDSNGLSSGNHFLEAAVAGLLEVIERDATTCHMLATHRHGHRMPRVDLDAVEFPLVLDLLDGLKRAEVGAVLYDCTVDTGVPVYMTFIYDGLARHVGIGGGFGAHLDPEIAMVRAITEAVQSRVVYIAGARDDVFRNDNDHFKVRDSQQGLAQLHDGPATAVAGLRQGGATGSFEGDMAVLIEKLGRVGLDQVILTDLGHDEVGIPVVRVTVPGLEGYASHLYAAGPRAAAVCRALAEPGGAGGGGAA